MIVALTDEKGAQVLEEIVSQFANVGDVEVLEIIRNRGS
jgi:hypothetical protein